MDVDVVIILFLFIAGLRLTNNQILDTIDHEYPDINDILSFTKSADTNVINRPPNVVLRNISIDLEKLDITKFRRKLDMFKNKIDPLRKDDNWTEVFNETRRLAYYGSLAEFSRASIHLIQTKCLDMMLQLIYMARHKIRQLESEKYFNRHDTSYRIAFLYRRIRRIWKRMMDIYTTMKRRENRSSGHFAAPRTYLILHHKAVRLHVDFVYLWWVLVNLHGKYNLRHFIPNTTPLD